MKKQIIQFHPFHIIDPSPWPLFTGFSAMSMVFGLVMYMHSYALGGFLAFIGFISLISILTLWWRDITREATYEKRHTIAVQTGLRYGMILFIVSEAALFFGLFWGFFHFSLAPAIEIGCVWPPVDIQTIDAFGVPLLNTILLLSSGITLTWAHAGLIESKFEEATQGLVCTLILAVAFLGLQIMEYTTAGFSMSDGIYGSIFYLATGFHGFHILVGALFLSVCLYRHTKEHFTSKRHLGFEFAAWYWHFVDIVWLFLFIVVYWWGNS